MNTQNQLSSKYGFINSKKSSIFNGKFHSKIPSRSIIHLIYERSFLLIALAFILLLLIFFYSSKTGSIFNETKYHRHARKPKLARSRKEPIIFSQSQHFNRTHKPSENVIAYLVASFSGEPRFAFNPYPRLREKILQLDERLNDSHVTDIIIFHTGYPSRSDMLPILEGSRRHVEFMNIDHIFYKFSPGFKPHITDPNWSQKGKWNYHHMCYFWFKQVFELKILQRYKYMMRLDDDSQIGDKWPNVFDLMVERKALYMANQREVDFDYILPGIVRIRNVTVDYINKTNLIVKNPDMFADLFNKTIEIPNFWNNIEIVDLAFMRSKEIVDFTKFIDESYGIFLYRWGDAPLRYVTLALFTNASQVLHRTKLGLGYCHPC